MESGVAGTIKLTGSKKPFQKYSSENVKNSGVYNEGAEIQLTKKKKPRQDEEQNGDEEEEVVVKKAKKKVKVESDDD